MDWMKHILILGLPRTGKTIKAVDLFKRCTHPAVFFNIQAEDYLEGLPKIYKSENWTPSNPKLNYIPINYQDGLKLLGNIYRYQKSCKGELQPRTLVLDEIWKYQDGSSQADRKKNIRLLQDVFSAGLRWNIQIIGTAQQPRMVDPAIYRNNHVFIFYELNPALYKHFSRTWDIDLFRYREWLSRPYHYMIYDGRQFFPCTPEIRK